MFILSTAVQAYGCKQWNIIACANGDSHKEGINSHTYL